MYIGRVWWGLGKSGRLGCVGDSLVGYVISLQRVFEMMLRRVR
jgi:hypothetical protein